MERKNSANRKSSLTGLFNTAAAVFLGGLFFISAIAPASVDHVDVVGDKDGFGVISIVDVPLDGTDMWALAGQMQQEPGDPGFTDRWMNVQECEGPESSIVYTHNFDPFNDPVISASLVIQHAGMANGPGTYWNVKVNGVLVGTIGPDNPYNASKIEEFEIPVELIGTVNEITLTYSVSDSSDEIFAINFSELTVVTPEPASIALLAMGSLALLRKKRS